MEVADEIVVINEGRVEQVGSPDELYETPATPFVMSFLGEVTTLGGQRLRPHDIDVAREPGPGRVQGVISRILKVGFEVRLSVLTVPESGAPADSEVEEVSVVMSRSHARILDLMEGDRVWLVPTVDAVRMPPAL